MVNKKVEQTDYNRPVAYDVDGKPLYAHPAVVEQVEQKQQVIVTEQPVFDETLKLKHDKSVKNYPNLNLCDEEFVITSVRRHPIGLFAPFIAGILVIAIVFLAIFNSDSITRSLNLTGQIASPGVMMMISMLIASLAVIFVYISYYIFFNNKYYLTNENIIQIIQKGLFKKQEQTVSLSRIEDSSFSQNDVLQQMFNYGSIRLSTVGDENTYSLTYVANPKVQIDILNDIVEIYKKEHPNKDN